MSWLIIAISAYFLNALNSVIDKFLLGRSIPQPIVYSFYVGILSITALVFAPFGLVWPGLYQVLASFLVGIIFLFALIAFFTALKEGEASRVVPIIGGLTPIFVFSLTYLFLEERLNWFQILAFFLLVLGGVLISIKKNETSEATGSGYSIKGLKIAILTALLFGFFYVSVKFIFLNQPFISGFIWTRMGSFLAALGLLIPSKNRELIFGTTKTLEIKMGGLFIFNKALAGLAFILLNYAISLASVTLVNALAGIQYVFLLILVILLSKNLPFILEEKITWPIMIQKISAIFLIGLGLLILAL